MKTKPCVWVLSAALGLGLLVASVAQAQQSILELIPEEALGFGVLNRLSQTDGKMANLVKVTGVPISGSPLETAKLFGKVEKGLDEKGSVALVAMPGNDSAPEPKPVILVPVTDYEAFIGNFEPEKVTEAVSRIEMSRESEPEESEEGTSEVRTTKASALVAKKGNYAVLVQTMDQELLESLLAGKKSIAGQLAPWQAWVNESDAVIVVTKPGLKLVGGLVNNEIEKVKPMFEAMAEQGAQAKAGLEVYQKMLTRMSDELTAAGFGVLIEEDASVRLTGVGQFAPDGQLAAWLKDMKAVPGNPWAGVANGPFFLAGAGALPEGLAEGLAHFSLDMMKNMPDIYGLSEEKMKQLVEAGAKAMKGVQGMSMIMGMADSGQPIYQGVSGTIRVDNSEAFLDQYGELVKSISELAADAEKSPLTKMTAAPTEIDGHKGLELSMDLSPMFDKEELAKLVPVFKAMYGPEGKLTVYLAAADEKTVVFAYLDKNRAAQAAKAVTDPEASLAADPSVAAMMKRLPADAQWLGLWSPGGTVRFAQSLIEGLAPEGAAMTLPEFPETPPVGFAMKASATDVRKELLIPVEVLKNVMDYVKQFGAFAPPELPDEPATEDAPPAEEESAPAEKPAPENTPEPSDSK